MGQGANAQVRQWPAGLYTNLLRGCGRSGNEDAPEERRLQRRPSAVVDQQPQLQRARQLARGSNRAVPAAEHAALRMTPLTSAPASSSADARTRTLPAH